VKGLRVMAIHRECYRVDIDGKIILYGVDIIDAKQKIVKWMEKRKVKAEVTIWYLPSYREPMRVDNNLDGY